MSTAADRDTRELFTEISFSRASQAIVVQMKALLQEGKLRPGDRLPSGRELCQQFGVSRVTVREALRIMEAGGLITTKVGARGGTYVSSPTPERIGVGLADMVSLSTLTAVEVIEARQIFEVGIMAMIAERATEDDVEHLRAMTARHAAALSEAEYTMEMSADFHTALAAAARIRAVSMIVQSFYGPLLMSMVAAKTAVPLMERTGVQEHAALVDAIAAHDGTQARQIMSRHLHRTATGLARPASAAAIG